MISGSEDVLCYAELALLHWHTMLVRPNPAQALASDVGYLNLLAGAEAAATLMRSTWSPTLSGISK
jgi:hypothetical protein